jgi:hypothetical protein
LAGLQREVLDLVEGEGEDHLPSLEAAAVVEEVVEASLWWCAFVWMMNDEEGAWGGSWSAVKEGEAKPIEAESPRDAAIRLGSGTQLKQGYNKTGKYHQ